MEEAGQKLKRARERLNLRYRDVEDASNQIAARHNNDEFVIALSRLSDIENKGTVPTIYRLYSLCTIYRLDINEVLDWYGVNVSDSRGRRCGHPNAAHAPDRFSANGFGDTQMPLCARSWNRFAADHFPEPHDSTLGQTSAGAAQHSGRQELIATRSSGRRTGPCIRSSSPARSC